MIALIQRVSKGKVVISDKIYSETGPGYVILLGIFEGDNGKEVEKLIDKIINLRIMSDQEGKMNKSILETEGEVLVVPQFTLAADLSAGRRPSFIKAMKPDQAEKLYELFVKKLKEKNIAVKTGEFGARMEVQIFNDGPVTIIADSEKV